MLDIDEILSEYRRNHWTEQVEALAIRNGKGWRAVFYGDVLKRYTKSVLRKTKLLMKRKRFTNVD